MSILYVILILFVIGFVLYLFNTRIPMDPMIKNIIYVIVVIAVLIWLLRLAGVWGGPHLRVG
jgi:hypothetical protein